MTVPESPNSIVTSEVRRSDGRPDIRISRAPVGRLVRWSLAVIVILYCIAGSLGNWFEVCTTTTKSGQTEAVCRPPELTDASVLALAALVLVLIWPDVSQIGAFGITLKRRVEAAVETADRSERRVSQLATEFSVQQVRVDAAIANSSSSRSDATASVGDIIINGEQIRRNTVNVPNKVEELRRRPTAKDKLRDEQSAPAPNIDFAQRVLELLRSWEVLDAALGLTSQTRRVRDERDDGLTAQLRARLRSRRNRFLAAFSDEIDVVRAARNTVAHNRPISIEDLVASIDLANSLISALDELELDL